MSRSLQLKPDNGAEARESLRYRSSPAPAPPSGQARNNYETINVYERINWKKASLL
ncbi:hypothetical protein DPMN_130561 [Dreissena polymorpha]|uniref:Uncharacterized protein n=1 Tax=Dreissena polymorpha TaxID=45954 RepID=A0A9D4H343_DREPO|nr:hypothetical protein DPMN_130561 [Dreissena polymorpha]